MKKLLIVANWKSYKSQPEAVDWFMTFKQSSFTINEVENKEVIICPQFPLLPILYDLIADSEASEKLLIRLGSQNISSFDEGAYTGEVAAKLLREYCAYSIVGHSERRQRIGEKDEDLINKVNIANKYNITPIFCIQGKDTQIPDNVDIVAYEPVFAIGTGNPDTPEDAEEVARYIKETHKVSFVLYGGSVDQNDVRSFTAMEHIDGVLVGGASRDPNKFIQIIKNA